MDITMFAPMPPIKSISPYCLHLIRELSKKVRLQIISFKQIPVILYAGKSTHEQGIKSKKIRNIEVNYIINWYNPLTWIRAALQTKSEVVHIQHWIWYSSIAYCYILPILKILGKRIIITVHNITPHIKDRYFVFFVIILNKIIFSYCDRYIVHNDRNKKKFMKLYNIKEKKLSIIKHGILTPMRKRYITQKKARDLLNIPHNKKILLFFGYIWRYKGLDTLLESLVYIKNKIPNVSLLIAGELVESSEKWKRYDKLIKKLDIDEYVIKALKYIPDSEIEIYFSAADLVVLPYREPFDTHGGVAALTLPFNKPMVVTDVGGLPEYVKDQNVIVPPDNANILAQKIIQILNNSQLLEKLSNDSKELSKILTWDNIANKTIDIYKDVM